MDLDVRRLRILREVALRGTITAAAGSLGFTPSAISQQLSALERESGTTLLERAGRRVRLTYAGQALVAQTGQVLAALESAQAALEASRTTIGGELRVAAAGSVAQALVLPVAAALTASYPQLRPTVTEHDPDDGLRELRLGGLDIVVAHEYQHDQRPPAPDLTRIPLLQEDLLAALPALPAQASPALGSPAQGSPAQGSPAQGSPAQSDWAQGAPIRNGQAKGSLPPGGPAEASGSQPWTSHDRPEPDAGAAGELEPVALAELADRIWAAEPAGSTCGRAVRTACRIAGFEPDVRYVSAEIGVALTAVATAGAVALVPRLGLAVLPPGVEVRPVTGVNMRRNVFAAFRAGSADRPAVALALAELAAAAARLATSMPGLTAPVDQTPPRPNSANG
jgi:DNA-binding transcriptional LysR family regulator